VHKRVEVNEYRVKGEVRSAAPTRHLVGVNPRLTLMMMICLPPQGTPPPPTQQPARPTAHTAHSQHCRHTALLQGGKTIPLPFLSFSHAIKLHTHRSTRTAHSRRQTPTSNDVIICRRKGARVNNRPFFSVVVPRVAGLRLRLSRFNLIYIYIYEHK